MNNLAPIQRFLLAGLLLATPAVHAATHYVDNDVSRPAIHRSIQSAVDAATAGDTIIVQGSGLAYEAAYIGKRLTLRGNGFGGDALPNLLGKPEVAKVKFKLTIGGTSNNAAQISANGTVVEGLEADTIEVNSNNCIIRRCAAPLGLRVAGSGNLIEGCLLSSTANSNYGVIALWVQDSTIINNQRIPVTGTQVRNCIIQRGVFCWYNSGSTAFHYCDFWQDLGNLNTSNSLFLDETRFYNCIFGGTSVSVLQGSDMDNAPRQMQNCLFLGSTVVMGNGTGTITDTWSNTFLGQGQWGETYRIKPGSPALTASTTGGEIGVFGGPTPFKVGGYPAIPRILRTELISADPTTGIRIRVEAESRD